MLLALLNSAGWVSTGTGPTSAIPIAIYAAIFGWLTWKQSFLGTVVGFILFALLSVVLDVVSIMERDYASPLRGSWAIIGQGMLLLNGVRAARYTRQPSVSPVKVDPDTSMSDFELRGNDKGVPGIRNGNSVVGTGIRFCSSCAIKVIPTNEGSCPACGKPISVQ